MRVLEDLGFYCVDNLPVALAPNVAKLAAGRDPALKGVALGVDSRERLFFPAMAADIRGTRRRRNSSRSNFS